MSAVPLPTQHHPRGRMETCAESLKSQDWMRIGAGSTLLTGSILLLRGKRRAGLLLTVTGAALAMLDNQEIVAEWWEALPRCLDKAQHMIEQTQHTVDDLTNKRDQIVALFGK